MRSEATARALVKTVSEASNERRPERSIGVPLAVPCGAARDEVAADAGGAETPSHSSRSSTPGTLRLAETLGRSPKFVSIVPFIGVPSALSSPVKVAFCDAPLRLPAAEIAPRPFVVLPLATLTRRLTSADCG